VAKKILYVEDEEFTRTLVKEILTRAGYEVVLAECGESGLVFFEKEKPDLVLVDVLLPGMSGWDFFEKLRKKDKDVKVAFLTVLDVSGDRKKKLMELGVSDYIIKPFTSDELVEKVKKILG
jgi:DNA-binding response OmpR family regulator